MKRARHLFTLAFACACWAGVVHLQGCAGDPPRPFEAGAPTSEPVGCTVLRQRNGEC